MNAVQDNENIYKRFIGKLGYTLVQEESNRIVSLSPCEVSYFMEDYFIDHIDNKKFKENISNIPIIVQQILKDSLDIYYAVSQNERNEYKGRACWARLMEMCDLGNVPLLGSNPNENPRLTIGLVNIIKRRQLLLKTLRNTADLYDNYNLLLVSLEHDIATLVEVKNVLLKQIIKGQKYLDGYIKKLLEKILYAEDELHEAISICLENKGID